MKQKYNSDGINQKQLEFDIDAKKITKKMFKQLYYTYTIHILN